MTSDALQREIHELDVTVWVGKSGLEPVVDELADQLDDRNLVKVKFLRAARGNATAEELADDLAEQVNAEVVQSRGHTAVMH
ncbi:YhbY family RNA-binding protein [Natronoarchaeum sp. GCM10025703]|uniref:YhbY family RNA-binding protein n=1 Tax=unclassified Natronoarchaeum TaxID=2620183 RepID=UPI0036236E8F